MIMSNSKKILRIILREISDIYNTLTRFNCISINVLESDIDAKKSIAMSLINISESVFALDSSFRDNNQNINWGQFKRIRNITAHKYGAIKWDIIWSIIHNELILFTRQINELEQTTQ